MKKMVPHTATKYLIKLLKPNETFYKIKRENRNYKKQGAIGAADFFLQGLNLFDFVGNIPPKTSFASHNNF